MMIQWRLDSQVKGLRLCRHRGCSQHAFGCVVERHHAITIDHAVSAHHVATVRGYDAELFHRRWKFNIPRDPMLATVCGVSHALIVNRPADFGVGEFYARFAGCLAASPYPSLSAV